MRLIGAGGCENRVSIIAWRLSNKSKSKTLWGEGERDGASIRVLTEPSGIEIVREGHAAVRDPDRDDA